MEAFKTHTHVEKDGTVTLRDVPFTEGESVEVIVLKLTEKPPADLVSGYPLRGTAYRFDDPFTPAAPEEDWDALR